MWIRDRSRPGQAENRVQRGAGYVIVLEPPSCAAARCAQWRYRAPSGTRWRSALPATRQAAGVPSAWSQPFQYNPRATTPMVRRRAAGPHGATAAQKAGAEGRFRNSGPEGRGRRSTSSKTAVTAGNPAGPNLPALSRNAQPTSTISDGQAGSPPHNVRPTWCGSANRSRQGQAENSPQRGAGYVIVLRTHHPAPLTRCAQWRYPAPSGSAMRSALPAHKAGRRRIIGVVAALSINQRATTPMVRRWAAGTHWHHSGPEGRYCGRRSRGRIRNPNPLAQPIGRHTEQNHRQ